ncbi:MAG: sigma-54-dependent Fis family transcriptional regulator [Bryobacterales bacterium]|nr:sigma-54-dependent Fis family transcriptional regulator [Bryobacterales bacterium]
MTDVPEIIGTSAALQQAISLIRKLAPTDATVLVQGESGTGKELAARALHSLSRRSGGPFRAVNAGALPPTLLEATLFGSRKGSYTDSKADQLGLFEAANGGTVFLDEVGEMTPDLQVRLLRVLQERKITRIGEFEERSVDVRVIAATNRDLRAEVAAKRFREDLFYRVSVVRLQLPPLRDRIPDIEPLARHMLDKHGQRLGRQLKGIESAAIEKLQHYRWPGNVRELENVIERAIALSDTDQITVADIEIEPPPSDGQMAMQEILDHPFRESERLFEQAYFQRLLSRTGNNKTKAAELAGLDRSSLHAHLRKIGRGPSND